MTVPQHELWFEVVGATADEIEHAAHERCKAFFGDGIAYTLSIDTRVAHVAKSGSGKVIRTNYASDCHAHRGA